MKEQERDFSIRKLTPRECFRLMDVDEENIDKIQAAGISNSQQYKLAGNSIVVSCLVQIFKQMFRPVYIDPNAQVVQPVKKQRKQPTEEQTAINVPVEQSLFGDDF